MRKPRNRKKERAKAKKKRKNKQQTKNIKAFNLKTHGLSREFCLPDGLLDLLRNKLRSEIFRF